MTLDEARADAKKYPYPMFIGRNDAGECFVSSMRPDNVFGLEYVEFVENKS
jgi:hypothetical protein